MTEIATVTSSGLNLHTEAHAASHISDTLTVGDSLIVERHERNWLRGRVVGTRSGKGLGQVGWVDRHFVSLAHTYDPLPVKRSLGLASMVAGLILVVLAVLAWLFLPS